MFFPRVRVPLHSRFAFTASASKAELRTAFRRYSTEQQPQKPRSSAPYIAVGAITATAVAYYYYHQNALGNVVAGVTTAKVDFKPTKDDYQKVYNRIAHIFDQADNYDDGSYAPVILRLAWHSAGTYDKETGTGGSNYATMRFTSESEHSANAGLNTARDLLEPVKKEFSWISYGDLWTLGGVAAVQEMAGPKITWRPGRIDGFAQNATPDGRLPDASQGADHLRSIFHRMGFNDQEIVALSGAHALGRCHPSRSGYEGPWTFSPTTLTNDYFKLLFSESWVWKKWSGPKQLEDKKTRSLMMLPTDYVLAQDKSFKKYAKAYADSEELFFKDFSAVVTKLFELGVPPQQFTTEPWIMKTLEEQKEQ